MCLLFGPILNRGKVQNFAIASTGFTLLQSVDQEYEIGVVESHYDPVNGYSSLYEFLGDKNYKSLLLP